MRIHLHGRNKNLPGVAGEKAKIDLTAREAGQIIVVFALMLTVMIGLVGIAIDVTYAWRTGLQIQRAADAGALAGVVYLPGDETTAYQRAADEAMRNGYSAATGATITANTVTGDDHQLDVGITASVPTFFVRIFGIDHWTVTREARAAYVTPVPMGSPLAYYGTYKLCDAAHSTPVCVAQGSPSGVTIASQGFFGAIGGEGNNRSMGDAFAPYWNPNPTLNAQYKAGGYDYIIESPSSGTLYLYDPIFCGTARKQDVSGYSGAADHWLGTPTPVSTYYLLWDTKNTPLTTDDDTLVKRQDFQDQNQIDMDTSTYGSSDLTKYSDSGSPSGAINCHSDSKHDNWWGFASLAAGKTYRLQVTTTNPDSPTANRNENFQNNFSIAVSGSGARVYGAGAMVTYANISSGSQEFYLAQIDAAAGAGKTVEILLFDPGDVGAPSWIQILPDGTPAWTPTTFSYTADNGLNGTNVTCIQTYAASGGSPPSGCPNATSGGILYQNSWVTIRIALPTSYGSTSNPLLHSGWWKIRYTVLKGGDTTTWEVSIRGNPVHLVPIP